MSVYRFRALRQDGREQQGNISAESPRQARQQLKLQGLVPLSLAAIGSDPAAGTMPRYRLKGSEQVLLTRQWATLLDAGIPVEPALSTLIAQSDEPRVRQLLNTIREALRAGQPLHRALSAFPNCFDSLYCALIAAGEQSGHLSAVMQRLADNLERRNALRQRVIQALAYPVIVALTATIVIGALMLYVVPQVVAVFQNGKQALPWLTLALIAISDLLRLTWPLLLLGTAGAVWFARHLLRDPARRLRWHAILLDLPLLGPLLLGFDSARLAQTLAILVGSGVPLLPALRAARDVVWLQPCAQALARATEQVREGVSLGRALAESKRFPPMLVHMVSSGEATGRLDEMLDKIAAQQGDEVSNRLSLSMSLLEPALILGMGVFVLLIVLAILQPILEINQLLR